MSDVDEISTRERVRSGIPFACIFAFVGMSLIEWTVLAVPIAAGLGFAVGWRFAIPGSDLLRPGPGGRARVGLWTGPGTAAVVLLISLTTSIARLDLSDSPTASFLIGGAALLAFACHLLSFAEMVGSLRAALRRPRSAAAVLLLLYWVLMPAWLTLIAWTYSG